MFKGKSLKLTGIEINGVRLSNTSEILQYICKQRERIEELEAENTELKEQISTKDILIKELQEQKVYWKESSFDWRHKFFKKGSTKRLVQKDEQLTNAKEIIKLLLWDLRNRSYEPVKDLERAEQFLNNEV